LGRTYGLGWQGTAAHRASACGPGLRGEILRRSSSDGLGDKAANQGNGRHLAWVGSRSLGGRTRSIVCWYHGDRHEQRKRLDGMCLVRSCISEEPWWVKLQPKREMRPVLRVALPKRNAGGSIPPLRIPHVSSLPNNSLEQTSSSQGRLPSPSSHGTGLVGPTSGSSGRRGRRFPSYSGAGVVTRGHPNPSESWVGATTRQRFLATSPS
jgi:hypothetical protein